MAGSYNHCTDDAGNYLGTELLLLDNLSGDAAEAIEEMFFMINWLARHDVAFQISGPPIEPHQSRIEAAQKAYYACAKGERSWPSWMGNL